MLVATVMPDRPERRLPGRPRPLLRVVQGRGLVHRPAAGLVAADEVLRLLLRGLHRAPRLLRLAGDLLPPRAHGLPAVGLPRHLVALRELLLAHAPASCSATS